MKITSVILVLALVTISSCTKKKNYDQKVLNVSVAAKVKGLDPVNAGDSYSSAEVARVYEGLLEYHYLKRPYELKPNLAEAMPSVSDDGLTYTFKIKPGVMFHKNKCFPNGERELVADDFVFSIKRMADLKNNSTGWWLLDGRIKGLNEWRERYRGKDANYDKEVEGLKALDRYTLQFKLKSQYPQFLYALAMVYTYAVPREAVEMYGQEFLNNPVGTGAFMITKPYTQQNTIEYVRNPQYREVFYPSEGASKADVKAGLLADEGQTLPLVDKIKVQIQTESSTRFLSFQDGNVDYSEIPKDNFDQVVTPDKGLTAEFKKRGIDLEVAPDLDITYIAFNHEEKIFQNVKLRQAISLAYNVAEANQLFYNGRGIPAQTVVPPGIGGYDEKFKNPFAVYDLAQAKQLLAEAGYPNGKGLPKIIYETTATTVSRQMSEFFAKSMKKIGINVEVSTNTWPQLTQKVKKRQAMMFGMAWLGDYPDAENFIQLLYGPNSAPGPNGSNFNQSSINKRFDRAKNMQPSPERAAKYAELAQELGRQVPLILGVHRTSFVLKHAWLKNYKFSTFSHGHAKYYNVDMQLKKQMMDKGMNKSINKTAESK